MMSIFTLKASPLSCAFPIAAWSSFWRVSGQLGSRQNKENSRKKKQAMNYAFFSFLFFLFFLADGLLLSQSRQRILCVNTLKTTLMVRKMPDGHLVDLWLMFDIIVTLVLFHVGYINGNLWVIHSQHLHHPLPSPGVLTLAEPISMGTADPPESHAKKKASWRQKYSCLEVSTSLQISHCCENNNLTLFLFTILSFLSTFVLVHLSSHPVLVHDVFLCRAVC